MCGDEAAFKTRMDLQKAKKKEKVSVFWEHNGSEKKSDYPH